MFVPVSLDTPLIKVKTTLNTTMEWRISVIVTKASRRANRRRRVVTLATLCTELGSKGWSLTGTG